MEGEHLEVWWMLSLGGARVKMKGTEHSLTSDSNNRGLMCGAAKVSWYLCDRPIFATKESWAWRLSVTLVTLKVTALKFQGHHPEVSPCHGLALVRSFPLSRQDFLVIPLHRPSKSFSPIYLIVLLITSDSHWTPSVL